MCDGRDEPTLRRHLGRSGPELSQVEPRLLERLPDLESAPLLAPEPGRVRLFDAVRDFLTRRHAACHGPASFYLGLLAELAGELDEAETLLDEAAGTAASMEAPPWLARIRFAQARLLVGSGRATGERVGGMLDEAIELSRALGMERILEQAEALRREAT